MKLITFVCFCIFLLLQSCNGQNLKSNYIDEIQTESQIKSLLEKTNDRYKNFKIDKNVKFSDEECQQISDSLKIKSWQKADFDQNGLTDLLVIGGFYDHTVLCIFDKGSNKYEVKPLTRRIFQNCTFPIVNKTKFNQPLIEYYFKTESKRGNSSKPDSLEKKTLIFKFGDFIELNNQIIGHKIENIEFSTSGCYGTCPIFILILNKNKTATWNAERYNKINNVEIQGKYKATISDEKFNEIIDLLNYLDFENLKNNYAVTWTDDQSCTLKITYDNGKTKVIDDYGLIGTYGLDRIYQLFYEIRENQKWEK